MHSICIFVCMPKIVGMFCTVVTFKLKVILETFATPMLHGTTGNFKICMVTKISSYLQC